METSDKIKRIRLTKKENFDTRQNSLGKKLRKELKKEEKTVKIKTLR